MVFEVRDLWPELPIAVGALRSPLIKGLARLLEWASYHSSSHIIALSPGMAEGVMRRGIPSNKVTIIPNSCDVDLFDVPSKNGLWVRERLGLKEKQPLIVYAGALGLINGVDYLVDIAAVMLRLAPKVNFLLLGKGAEYNKVKEKAERLGVLNNNLWIWPPMPKIKITEVMAAATMATSLFIPLTAMWNNSANKFFDALAAGKPIAINYRGWQADLLQKNGAGVVLPPKNPEIAAQKLIEFISNEDRLERSSKAALRLAHEKFNRDKLYNRIEYVLDKALQLKTK
jgi:glycosyltransferase involved in cell wall biosynthesis